MASGQNLDWSGVGGSPTYYGSFSPVRLFFGRLQTPTDIFTADLVMHSLCALDRKE